MKIKILFIVIFLVNINLSYSSQRKQELAISIDHAMKVASEQSLLMCKTLKDKPGLLPRTIDKNGKLMTSDSRWWCSGFFPGVLWYLYEYSGKNEIKDQAELFTKRVEREKFTTTNHDVGFMIYCSFGNGYRLTGNQDYKNVIETACNSLSTRYNDKIKSIKSWDFIENDWQFPVIIDNMMNLEMLLWGSKQFNNNYFRTIAVNHANTTQKYHFRDDYSCYHLVSYDTLTLKPEFKRTYQGASDSSSWARGQAWALYGYTVMYRETKNLKYLDLARHIAQFIIHNPNLPKDKIPYWDFNAPNIPNEERDASAAAIMASALIELSSYVDKMECREYMNVVETQLSTLCSDEYLANPGTNGNFILKHSVGSKPHQDIAPYFGEVNVPLTYADYYFVEALVKYKKYKSNNALFSQVHKTIH